MREMEFCVPCLFGLEGIAGDELRRLEIENVRVENGRVLFSGDETALAKSNICLRTFISPFTSIRKAWNTLARSFFSLSYPRRGPVNSASCPVVDMSPFALAFTMAEAIRRLCFNSP